MDTESTAPAEYEYDSGEFLKNIEAQRNNALTQAAQMAAVITQLTEERNTLRRENDSLRQKLEGTNE